MISEKEIFSQLAQAFNESHLPLRNKAAGKVREWYPLTENQRLIITTDRLSAFDRILASVPYKGQVLNQLSAWWFNQLSDILPHHLINLPDPNAAVVRNAQPLPIEVIVRGYISGVTSTALWRRYELGEREIYGYRFADGLKKNQPLPQAIITPTTKGGPSGHDERLTPEQVVSQKRLTASRWEEVQNAALAIFARGQAIALQAGLILVDTKYEFGISEDNQLILIDEVHTPDSSRFWKADSYESRFLHGKEPENFDKEFVRMAYAEQGYRGEGEPPAMPNSLWVAASQRYISIYEMLTGQPFVAGEYPVNERLIKNLMTISLLGKKNT